MLTRHARPGHTRRPQCGMTLFDVADLFGSEPSTDGLSGASHVLEPAAPPEPATPLCEVTTPETAPEAEAATAAVSAPEVEVRISKRRKKSSEAKWVGGRIIVSLPA